MKKTILILTAIATLASCGGGTGSGRDGVHAVSTT
ncbi:MAG: lipoprotein, partial [Bacteroidales bacterium]|nr:lipoprotein [Bacteroidales bacterium]